MKKIKFIVLLITGLAITWACNEQFSEPNNELSTNPGIDKSHWESTDLTTYELTLENLSPATGMGASQPFSPPIITTHKPPLRLFKMNSYASEELQQIAEDAVNGPMLDFLNNSGDVFDVEEGTGVIFPGSSETFYIEAERGKHKLSLVTMLVNTNDGFTGIDKFNLPKNGTVEIYLNAYDAGTEQNTESISHIPGPCCGNPFMRVPTHERIQSHSGILGVGDLDPQVYGWNEHVAKLTVTRIN